MAGKTQRKPTPIERMHRAYREEVEDMADSFGFDADWLATHFEWFTCMRQFEQDMPRNLAAFMAWRDVQASFLKQGTSEPD